MSLSAVVLVGFLAAPNVQGPRAAREVRKALEAAGVERHTHGEDLGRRAREAGLDEARVGQWLDANLGAPDVTRLLEILGEIGTPVSYPLLWRLSRRSHWEAEHALDRVFQREMQLHAKDCVPPTEEETAARRARALEIAGPETTPQAISDLAYLLAATSASGPAVGAQRGPREPRMPERGADSQRELLHQRLRAAEERGDLLDAAQAARDYLATLGYPGALREDDESAWTWGGGRHSHVMRTLARLDEALGSFQEAADLYRRANPSGGACGTSVSRFWAEQVAGLVRSEERLRGCERIVPERLLAIDGTGSSYRPAVLGPRRLAEAGFDVERLYRGALVTAGKSGADGWESRVLAIEGYADTAGRRAIPKLLELAGSSDPELARRAVEALGALGDRHCFPCGGMGMHGTSGWRREVESLDQDCEKPIPENERDELSRKLLPFAEEGELSVRQAAVSAIGNVAATTMLPALKMLALEDTVDPNACWMLEGPEGPCTPIPVIREEAKEALERIEGVLDAERRCAEEPP